MKNKEREVVNMTCNGKSGDGKTYCEYKVSYVPSNREKTIITKKGAKKLSENER